MKEKEFKERLEKAKREESRLAEVYQLQAAGFLGRNSSGRLAFIQ